MHDQIARVKRVSGGETMFSTAISRLSAPPARDGAETGGFIALLNPDGGPEWTLLEGPPGLPVVAGAGD